MLDIKFIRDNADIIKSAIIKKKISFDLNTLITKDDERLLILREVEDLRAEQNAASSIIQSEQDSVKRTELIDKMKVLKETLISKEEKLRAVMEEWRSLMLEVPNVPDPSVPDGDSDEDNVEVKVWGEKPTFDFEAKDHIELMQNLKMVDFERGIKVH